MQSIIESLRAALPCGFNLAAKAAIVGDDGRLAWASHADSASSLATSIDAVQEFFAGDWRAGDAAVLNDPNQGATHVCQFTAVAPLYTGERVTSWAATRVNVPDLGGWLPGGYSPQAVDRWAEAARFVPAKLLLAGRERREVLDLLSLNSRTPIATRRVALAAARAALEFGQFASPSDFASLRKNESAQFGKMLAPLGTGRERESAPIQVPAGWPSPGRVEVEMAVQDKRLQVAIRAPGRSPLPINLAAPAARDIVHAALAAVLGAGDWKTDALASSTDVRVEGELLSAPVMACVGVGRETSGAALHAATCAAAAALLRRPATGDPTSTWLQREVAGAVDWATGSLDAASINRILSIESEIPQ